MTSTKKIIIFLTPLSNSKDRKRRKELLNSYCRQNNFTILKILEQSSFDHTILRELVAQILHEPKGTITTFIEDKLLNTPNSIVLFSVIGTLYLLGLIKTKIYNKSYTELKLCGSILDDFLSIATFNLNFYIPG
ncbi:MAG: hypothetical protein LN560_02245 [Rickettsia endosymbiont of Sceptobius lativentris]|nr:hypothetical protein [Rickettsia endosymbiont of Sceptobius lativentris]